MPGALWVAVYPLGLDAVLAELESVCPPFLLDQDIHLEERGFSNALRVECKDSPLDTGLGCPLGIRIEHRVTHVAQGSEDVGLSGCVGAEDADDGKDGQLAVESSRNVGAGNGGWRNERELLVVTKRTHVRAAESQKHRSRSACSA